MISRASYQIAPLTGIRGIAAACILLCHISVISFNNGFQNIFSVHVFENFWIGVDLFFVLSGFVLMHAHQAQFDHLDSGSITSFYTARAWRIFPVCLAALSVILVLVSLDHGFDAWYKNQGSGNLSVWSFVRTALLATRWLPGRGEWNEPTWSVSTELVGYLFFPLLAYSASRAPRRMAIVAVSGILVGFAGLTIVTHRVGHNDIRPAWALLRMACGFCLGIGLYRIWITASEVERLHHPKIAWIGLGLIIPAFADHHGMILVEAGFSMIVYSVASNNGLLSRALSSRACMFMGRISFPLYVLHVMPLLALTFYLHSIKADNEISQQVFSFYVLAIIFLAWIVHKTVEAPAHRFARSRSHAVRQAIKAA